MHNSTILRGKCSVLVSMVILLISFGVFAETRTNIVPGATCMTQSPGNAASISHHYGYFYNQSAGAMSVMCPIELTDFAESITSLEVTIDDRNASDTVDCWFCYVTNLNVNTCKSKKTDTPDSFKGAYTFVWNVNDLLPSQAISEYIKCNLPAETSSGPSSVRLIRYTHEF